MGLVSIEMSYAIAEAPAIVFTLDLAEIAPWPQEGVLARYGERTGRSAANGIPSSIWPAACPPLGWAPGRRHLEPSLYE